MDIGHKTDFKTQQTSEAQQETDFFNFGLSDKEDSEYGNDFEYYSSAKQFHRKLSFRGYLHRFFIRNSDTRLVTSFVHLAFTVLICIVYAVRVLLDNSSLYAWRKLFWVHRPLPMWLMELVLSIICLSKTLIVTFAATKRHRLKQLTSAFFFLELFCAIPIILTVFHPDLLQNLYAPTFLNCWLGKKALEKIFNDLHLTRQRFQTISVTLYQQMVLLLASTFCLVFTTVCGIQHIQRASHHLPLTFFESVYFVIVTFSTVGYGDISPDIWPSQVFVMIMIIIALVFIPRQLEVLLSTWLERKNVGGEYSRHSANHSKHVVVCSTRLSQESVMDFLNEFYAHQKLEDYTVVLLCSTNLDSSMLVILKDPKWSQRVIYMKGCALKETDLQRCRVQQAEACFLLAHRPTEDRHKADRHTVLRSWSVKDFGPRCKLYIQLFSSQYKMHVTFAEHVVCEDEFKYALLANNCLYPGLSTLVYLLIHASTELNDNFSLNSWQQVYRRHSKNEIYHVQLYKSALFSKYEGIKFTIASAEVHDIYGVTLLAVLPGASSTKGSHGFLFNPGSMYFLKRDDYCFYMSSIREELMITDRAGFTLPKSDALMKNMDVLAEALMEYQTLDGDMDDDCNVAVFDTITNLMEARVKKQLRQCRVSSSNVDCSTVCDAPSHGDDNTDVAVLQQGKDCDVDGVENMDHRHGAGKVLQFYPDMDQEKLTTGLPPLNAFMMSQRAVCHILREPRPLCCLQWGTDCEHCRYKNVNDRRWHHQLIIIASQTACSDIQNFIVPLRSSFIAVNGLCPIVILLEDGIDDLLRAGINKASHLVVVNQESYTGEDTLADADTIIAVQTVFKMFPNANIITELSRASNIRFMHFCAEDTYQRPVSNIKQIRIKRVTVERFPLYGDLYKCLCSSTGEIPFAVYRTEKNTSADRTELNLHPLSVPVTPFARFGKRGDVDFGGMVRSRLRSLDMPTSDYSEEVQRADVISYIIANPTPSCRLKVGDIVYVMQPCDMLAKPSKTPQSCFSSETPVGHIVRQGKSAFISSSPDAISQIPTQHMLKECEGVSDERYVLGDGWTEHIGRFSLTHSNLGN